MPLAFSYSGFIRILAQKERSMNSKAVRRTSTLAFAAILAFSTFSSIVRADDRAKDEDRLQNSGKVTAELMHVPDNIPQKLLNRADCVVVIPSVIKAGFVVGAAYGRGAMTCRTGENFRGGWGAPTMMALEGGSWGLQIGGQATDFVLLVMDRRGANAILTSKVKLGGDATVAAGPWGRDAEADTDATFRAEILTYSRTRGAFIGISLEGSTLRPDNDANLRIYGKKISARQIVLHNEAVVPDSAHLLIETLNNHSPKRL
jgi:lipid-binding SYLF domain-containing protein